MKFPKLIFILLLSGLTVQLNGQAIDSTKIVRVLSFNILHGATTKGDFDLDAIAKVIKEAQADLVALQEVDFMTRRAKGYDLATELGWRTKMAPLFGKAMDYDGGGYGEGVLSRFMLIRTRNVPLPFTPGNEPRAALEVTTTLASGDTIQFIGTHLDHLRDETDRVQQAKEINRVFKDNSYPSILAGDLNAEPNSRPMQILRELWTPSYAWDEKVFTYTSESPTKKIDYVLFYPVDRWQVLSKEIICDEIASDHCAVLVSLLLR